MINSLSAIPKVLVVDDEEDYLNILNLLLSAEGFKVETATDGKDGFEKLKSQQYDLAIIDINMPRMDGYTLCREIRPDDKLKNLPVIMLTVRSRDEEQADGREARRHDG